jgi:hypothetical protein
MLGPAAPGTRRAAGIGFFDRLLDDADDPLHPELGVLAPLALECGDRRRERR